MKYLFALILLIAHSLALSAVTYVRTDGGDATQCTGLADAKYPGTGTGLACAWGGPMVALPPGGPALIKPGDTLTIRSGSYMMGWGTIGTKRADGSNRCSASYPYACTAAPVPPNVKILGDCKKKPELWGTQRAYFLLDLSGSNGTEVSCLELTDHAQCVYAHADPKMLCERDKFPYGDYADRGIQMMDATGVKLSKLNIHGFSNNAMWVGRVTDLTVEDTRMAGNGWAGWQGDTNGDGKNKGSSNEGTITLRRVLIEYNGCVEKYPVVAYTLAAPGVAGCWGQSAGGYGDGLGTGQTNGNWIVDDSVFRFNTSDGLDLLYHREGTVTVTRSRFRGNASNQAKIAGSSLFVNNVVQGICGYFDKKPYTWGVDNCRAVGDAYVIFANKPTETFGMYNNTLIGEGNTIMTMGGSAATVESKNNIFIGLPYFLDPSQRTAAPYSEGPKFVDTNSIYQDLRNTKCDAPGAICGSAGLMAATRDTLTVRLQPTSKARDSGAPSPLTPSPDYLGAPRVVRTIDRGAVEAP